jgi:predicted RNA methylase
MDEIDQAYFGGYEDPEIHREMLQDEARVEAYRVALNLLSPGKVVIDVGAGTGILSLMAMDAGAKSVYALEYSSIAKQAEIAFSKRRERSKMMVFKGLAEEFSLGALRADLIVSEWMGYFLINEHMLPSVLAVRDKWLGVGGLIIPQ